MNTANLIQRNIALTIDCPHCGNSVILDRWKISVSFNSQTADPLDLSAIDIKNIAGAGVIVYGPCKNCSEKMDGENKGPGLKGIAIFCSLEEFSKIVGKQVDSYMTDLKNGAVRISLENGSETTN